MNNLNLSKFAMTAAFVAVASVVVNVALCLLGRMISDPPGFGPYQYGSIVMLTLVGVIGAAVVYAPMRRFIADTAKANRYFIILSIVLLIASFYPDVMLPYSTDPDEIGWTYDIMANLMLMHVATAGLVMYYYTRPQK